MFQSSIATSTTVESIVPNKKDIDDVVDKFENDIWDEYDKYTAELEEKEKTE